MKWMSRRPRMCVTPNHIGNKPGNGWWSFSMPGAVLDAGDQWMRPKDRRWRWSYARRKVITNQCATKRQGESHCRTQKRAVAVMVWTTKERKWCTWPVGVAQWPTLGQRQIVSSFVGARKDKSLKTLYGAWNTCGLVGILNLLSNVAKMKAFYGKVIWLNISSLLPGPHQETEWGLK